MPPLSFADRLRSVAAASLAITLMLLTSLAAISVRAALLGGGRELCRWWLFRPANALVLGLAGVRLELSAFRPSSERALYLFNHSSSLDTLLVLALPLRDVRYLLSTDVAAALPHTLAAWVMGTHLVAPRQFPERRRADFARVSADWARAGACAIVSPEGQRVTTGELGAFQPEVFELASELGLDLIPVFLDLPHERNPWRSFWVRAPLVVGARTLPAIAGSDPERARALAHAAFMRAHRAAHARAEQLACGDA